MSLISPNTQKLLQLSMLKGVGPAALKKAATLHDFLSVDIGAIGERIRPIGRALLSSADWTNAIDAAQRQLLEAEKRSARIISGLDDEYPALLAGTKDDPFILFVQGRLAPIPEKSVAVIGTREPTAHGVVIADRITSYLVEQGWSIVSGLAIGSDAAAHRTALRCKGHTVAVLAHGLQMITPSRHKKLAEEILECGGALVSEYRFGQEIQKSQYVKRDRTQAGLAQGVVMIQSDLVGGSLHASRAALAYDRWLAVPYPTEKDRELREPKVQANLVIAEGTDKQRAQLLECDSQSLKNVIVLRGKDDYVRLLSPVVKHDYVGSSDEVHRHWHRDEQSTQSDDLRFAPHFAPEAESYARDPSTPEIQESRTFRSATGEFKARQKYILGKLRDIDAFLDCLAEASSETRLELQFELESVLAHMFVLVAEAESRLKAIGAIPQETRTRASKLSQEILSARNRLIHGDGIPESSADQSEFVHVAASARVKTIRTEFLELTGSLLELLQERSSQAETSQ